MNDIFKDMQAKAGCDYISDLPSYRRKVWQEMKQLNPADYPKKDSRRFFCLCIWYDLPDHIRGDKQQRGREEQCRN